MATILKTKNSVTTTVAPTTLQQGELAVNITDKKMWVGNAATTPVQIVGAGATNRAGGSNTQVQYNSSGDLAGSANMTFSGTALTLANDASISGLTVGKGGGSQTNNTAVGANSTLVANTTGTHNTAIGSGALPANTTGGSNTSVGSRTLENNNANNNTAIGYQSMLSNTSGTNNAALGWVSLNANTTGSSNTGLGVQALASNTTASNNTAVGYQAGYTNTTGADNVAVGRTALYLNTTGSNNLASGNYALYSNTTGNYNTALGGSALGSNTTASNNTAVGYQAGYNNIGTSGNTFIGYQSSYSLNQSSASNHYNTSVGYQSSYSATTGYYNTTLGGSAGYNITTGTSNVMVGIGTGTGGANALTTGSNCIGIGYYTSPSAVSVSHELIIGTNQVTGKGANTGFISPNGGGVYQGNNSAAWSITSDQRLKKNIVDNTTGLNAISQIKVRNFEYRTADEVTDLPSQNAIEITGVQLGAIAQELKQILPDCVKTESSGVMSVDTTNLTWYLINAIKELNDKVTALENK